MPYFVFYFQKQGVLLEFMDLRGDRTAKHFLGIASLQQHSSALQKQLMIKSTIPLPSVFGAPKHLLPFVLWYYKEEIEKC